MCGSETISSYPDITPKRMNFKLGLKTFQDVEVANIIRNIPKYGVKIGRDQPFHIYNHSTDSIYTTPMHSDASPVLLIVLSGCKEVFVCGSLVGDIFLDGDSNFWVKHTDHES